MGLFSSNPFGSGDSSSSTSNNTSTTTTNTNLTGGAGTSVLGDVGTVIVSDMNAIDDATHLAQNALDAGVALNRSSLDFGSLLTGKIVNATTTLQGQSNDFASDALNTVAKYQGNALQDTQSLSRTVLDANSSLLDKVIGGLQDFVTQGQKQLGTTVSTLNEISKEQNTSADQRVADIASNALKYGLLALVAIAGVFALTKAGK